MQPDEVRLRHMLDAAHKTLAFTDGRSRDDLDTDEQLSSPSSAFLRSSAKPPRRSRPRPRAAHPEIPWRDIAGTRDRLIHGYFDVDLDVVWSIAMGDLPALVASLEAILESED